MQSIWRGLKEILGSKSVRGASGIDTVVQRQQIVGVRGTLVTMRCSGFSVFAFPPENWSRDLLPPQLIRLPRLSSACGMYSHPRSNLAVAANWTIEASPSRRPFAVSEEWQRHIGSRQYLALARCVTVELVTDMRVQAQCQAR
ncbi:hypothetical protein NDN08_000979 [Rhodosorus marinus]|uniref:Uncharacterized protein n=1 Tax=Rhodosorus marinus TaxID=101924 RepID=A0AAV8UTQ1_9RHOD|nr:hypothetical protein NDN08_000979 [Rhodosorus marinus]